MDKNTCLALLNGISFKPGWTISAAFSTLGLPYIRVTASIDTVNSNRDQMLMGYPEKITIEPTVMCTPSDYATANELYFAIFQWLMEVELHECREFFRVAPNGDAPFHPHKASGNAAWAAENLAAFSYAG